MEEKATIDGFPYYDNLPVGYRLATINDFHTKGTRKIGKKYLIQWLDKKDVFEICYVSNTMTSTWLNQFIEASRVFVEN